MSFCSNCGTELTDGTAFCPNCGAGQVRTFGAEEPTAVVPEPEVIPAEPVYQAPVYQEPVYQAPVYQTPAEPAKLPTSAKILGLISMICGLVSLGSGCGGFALGIAAIILSNIASNKVPGVPNTKAKVGKITGIIGIVVSVICLIIAYIAYIVLMATGAAFVTEHMYDI